MSKHTPGPWQPIIGTVTIGVARNALGDEAIIAVCCKVRPEAAANARLIAAAPALLEACCRMLRELNDSDVSVGAEEDMAAAVKKAGGDWLSKIPDWDKSEGD